MNLSAMHRHVADNLRAARFDRAEMAGSLGDLGTFLPLLVAMSRINGLNFATSLFFAGVFSILTGMMLRIPMAVQPMKAIAAIAIAQGLTPNEITTAGALVSLAVLTLGVVGAIDLVQRLIPAPVVRGMQCALGITLLFKAVTLAMAGAGVSSASELFSAPAWGSAGGLGITLGAAALVMATFGLHRFPVALVLFAAGIVLAAWTSPSAIQSLSAGLTLPGLAIPALADLPRAFTEAALPQLPLTTLNSVVAVCALSVALYPNEPKKHASPKSVAVSVGLMNLIGVWFGAMPMCHGAGGLAGQHRFGARTNGSILMLGVAKVTLAVLFGASLLPLCAAFPRSILAVMLAVSGVELSRASVRGLTGSSEGPGRVASHAMAGFAVTLAACLATDHVAIGVAAGVAFWWLLRWLRPTPPPSRSGHPSSSG